MSTSRNDKQSWSGKNHSIKNTLNQSIGIINLLHNEAEKKNNENKIITLSKISLILKKTVQAVTVSYKEFMGKEPTLEEQKDSQSEHLALLDKILELQDELKEKFLSDEEKGFIEIFIDSINDAKNILDPKTNNVIQDLKTFLQKSKLSNDHVLSSKENKNSLEFDVSDPSLMQAMLNTNNYRIITDIIDNCIANSNNFCKKGKITLSIKLTGEDSKEIAISIEDNGSGMPKKIKEKVLRGEFGATVGGTGVGLADLVNRIKDNKINGKLSIESNHELGLKGTKLTWTFPLNNVLTIKQKSNKLSPLKEKPLLSKSTNTNQLKFLSNKTKLQPLKSPPLLELPVPPTLSMSSSIKRRLSLPTSKKSPISLRRKSLLSKSPQSFKPKLDPIEKKEDKLIYFIDDVLLNRKIFKKTLNNKIKPSDNLFVKVFNNANDVIADYKIHKERVKGMIVDLHLGDNSKNGGYVVEQIRNEEKESQINQIPIYLYSGDNLDKKNFPGVTDIIVKASAEQDELLNKFFSEIKHSTPKSELGL
ncbi:ATP-binding protein [Gammaproteobacteria bacterium]|nr:ATP-binding protein [Gammaproteobacteria bacterium]